jgi:hypothetical protein
MATIKQIEANRLNAKKSTGPATAAGKSAVRFNALKSGIDAASMIIPGEDPEQLKTFAEDITAAWRPADPLERELVDQLVDDAWRLRRLRAAETQIWTLSIEDRRKSPRHHHPHTEVGDAFRGLSETLPRLHRLVAGIKRSSHQVTADLQRIQALRIKAAAEAPIEEEPAPPEPLTIPPEPQTDLEEQSQFDAPPSVENQSQFIHNPDFPQGIGAYLHSLKRT